MDLDQWRSFFDRSGADIWTVIHEAINLAAADYPKDFRYKRGEIAETLFSRNLLQVRTRDATDEPLAIAKCSDARDGEIGKRHAEELIANANDHDPGNCDDDVDVDVERCTSSFHDQAETLSDELEEETLAVRDINGIKETLADADQPENVVFEALQRLKYMDIKVETLKATEIGRHVNNLRKHSSKRVRTIVKELVRHWKFLVDAWVRTAQDVTAAADNVDTECEEFHDSSNQEGLPAPPLDEGALLEAGASTAEFSQLFDFIEGEAYGQSKDRRKASTLAEQSVKDNNCSSRSHSGSLLTDSSDFDAKASTSHSWGFATPEERGSATRDIYPSNVKQQNVAQSKTTNGIKVDAGGSKSVTSGSGYGPGRPLSNDVPKMKASLTTGKASGNLTVQRPLPTQTSVGDKVPSMKLDKNQVDHKLELAKRRLHQGYQQAENAKKQRTVQVLDLPDLPKTGGQIPMRGKFNQPLHIKSGLGNNHWGQNRKYS